MAPHIHHRNNVVTANVIDHNGNIQDPTAILTAKAVTMVVLCMVSICMGVVPLQLGKCFKWAALDKSSNSRATKIVGMLLGFGGGVLFCTTFIHMLPEVTEQVEKLVRDGRLPHQDFPLTEVFVCAGFFIMYLVEEIVHTKLRHREKLSEEVEKKEINRSTNELVENGQVCKGTGHANGHSHGYGHGHTHLPAVTTNNHHDFVISSLRGLLIVLGLSVHELFEGLAIGLESSANDVWYMFAAVAAHKFVIAFCIGVELVASRTHQCLSIIYVCTFAVVSPLGIGIGMLLVGGGDTAASGPLAVILQGIATGTLLYVVFFEILHHNRDGLHQYLSILIGFLIMFGLQIATMLILGLGSLTLGMLPLIVSRFRYSKKQKCAVSGAINSSPSATSSPIEKTAQGLLTSLLLCFGGGVLLFTTFLHLAPEVRQSVERHQLNGQLMTVGTLSMAELLFCIGFFVVYFVEEIVHATLTGRTKSSDDLLYRTVSIRRCNKSIPISSSTTTISTVAMKKTSSPSSWEIKRFKYENEDRECAKTSRDSTNNYDETNKSDNGIPSVFIQSSASLELSSENIGSEDDRFVVRSTQPVKSHSHNHNDTSVRGLLAVIALSFHAIFEGLAVGLEPSLSSVVYLAGAIATHKLVIAFCVGMELYVTGATTRTIVGYLSIFSMVTPIGIILGVSLGHFNNDSENLGPIPTILQGMAAGTLLYVVFFEVLGRERANDKSGLLQLAAIIMGFMLMLGLQLATSHSHSHANTHGVEHGDFHGSKKEHEDHDHNHEDHHTDVFADTIDRISTSVTDVLTNAIVSTTTESSIRTKTE